MKNRRIYLVWGRNLDVRGENRPEYLQIVIHRSPKIFNETYVAFGQKTKKSKIAANGCFEKNKIKESSFRPPLCTYRLNWARRTSWGWWDDLDDTVLQTQDSKFEPWRSEAEHATSRSRRLPTILTFTRGWGRNIFLFLSNRRDREPSPELWREKQRC